MMNLLSARDERQSEVIRGDHYDKNHPSKTKTIPKKIIIKITNCGRQLGLEGGLRVWDYIPELCFSKVVLQMLAKYINCI